MARQPVGLLDQPRRASASAPSAGRLASVAAALGPGRVRLAMLHRPLQGPSRARSARSRRRAGPRTLPSSRIGPARAVRREGRHQRRAVVAVALVHARDQPLADVAREVEVDVGQPVQVLVQEAPERQPARDRVDVREPSQVADERGDRRAPPAPGRQQRARIESAARAPRRRPRAPARASRGGAGRSRPGRAGRSPAAPLPAAPPPRRGRHARRPARRDP